MRQELRDLSSATNERCGFGDVPLVFSGLVFFSVEFRQENLRFHPKDSSGQLRRSWSLAGKFYFKIHGRWILNIILYNLKYFPTLNIIICEGIQSQMFLH